MFYPSECHVILRRRKVAWIGFLMMIAIMIFNIPRIVENEAVPFNLNTTTANVTFYQIAMQDFAKDNLYQMLYTNVFSFLFIFGIPNSVVAYLNITLIIKIFQIKRSGELLNRARAMNISLSFLLFPVSTFSFVYCSLRVVHTICLLVSPDFFIGSFGSYLRSTIILCSTINSSVNIFFYSFWSNKFQEELSQGICCTRDRNENTEMQLV